MRLALIFDKSHPETTGVYFERAARALGIECSHWWLRDAPQIPSGYDAYVRIDHGDDYLTRLPDHLRPSAFYAIDTHLSHCWQKIRRVAPHYDIVFCAQGRAARALRNGVWLPLACDLEYHGSVAAEPVWDVAFIGNDGGVPRKFYLQALRERYPKHRIGTASHTELAAIYGRAHIGFNYSIADDVNMRMFEVLAAKCLLVTNALKGSDLQQLGLEDRRHLVLYRRPEEVFTLIDHFLAHPNEGQAIAEAGAREASARHTYAQRVQQMLEQFGKLRGAAAA